MEQNFQTSFIPKKPMVKERVSYAQPIGIFLIVSLFILFTVLIATGGFYFYKGVLTKNIESMKSTLSLAENRFEPSKITELQTLDRRLRAANEILSQHITILPVFTALEQITMKTIRYTQFGYDLGTEKSTGNIAIKMSGVAIGYRSVALQSDLFAQNKNIIDPVFSNLTLDDKGNVNFNLDFSVDSTFVNYKQALLTTTN